MFFAHNSLFVTLMPKTVSAVARLTCRKYSRVSRLCKDLAELEAAKPPLLEWKVKFDAIAIRKLELSTDGISLFCLVGRDNLHVNAYSSRTDCPHRGLLLKAQNQHINGGTFLEPSPEL